MTNRVVIHVRAVVAWGIVALALTACMPATESPATQTEPSSAAPVTAEPATVQPDPTLAPTVVETAPASSPREPIEDLSGLWSYGLTSARTGEPLIAAGDEHLLDPATVEYGYNVVVDAEGQMLRPGGAPLRGGEQLVRTDAYQDDINTREYARVVSIMAPIRDTILYRFEETSRDEWLALTAVLTLNGIKTVDAPGVDRQSILSNEQVYDYIAAAAADGSPVMRYLEEAELELKCLAFQDFDFTNPEGENHCETHGLVQGSGIRMPDE